MVLGKNDDGADVVVGAPILNMLGAGAADSAAGALVVAGVLLGKKEEPAGFGVEFSAGLDCPAAPKSPPVGAALAGGVAFEFWPRFPKSPPLVGAAGALLPKMLEVCPPEVVAVVADAGAADDVLLLFPMLENRVEVGGAVEVVLLPDCVPAALVVVFPKSPPDGAAGLLPNMVEPLFCC